jgi:hypothetical protein
MRVVQPGQLAFQGLRDPSLFGQRWYGDGQVLERGTGDVHHPGAMGDGRQRADVVIDEMA